MIESAQFHGYTSPEEKRQEAYFERVEEHLQRALDEIDKMTGVMLEQGIVTEAQVKTLHRHFEAYLVGWEMAQWILHEKPQSGKVMDRSNRAYLTSWLLKQPGFFNEVLKGDWPEWLPKPVSFSSLE